MSDPDDVMSFYRPPFTGRTIEIIEIDIREKESTDEQ